MFRGHLSAQRRVHPLRTLCSAVSGPLFITVLLWSTKRQRPISKPIISSFPLTIKQFPIRNNIEGLDICRANQTNDELCAGKQFYFHSNIALLHSLVTIPKHFCITFLLIGKQALKIHKQFSSNNKQRWTAIAYYVCYNLLGIWLGCVGRRIKTALGLTTFCPVSERIALILNQYNEIYIRI